MKIALIADVHLGNHRVFGGQVNESVNTRFRMILDTLHEAATVAIHEGCTQLVVLGDLFDAPNPLPIHVQLAHGALSRPGLDVWLMTGNHDQRSDGEDHALAAFDLDPKFHVVNGELHTNDRYHLRPFSAHPFAALCRSVYQFELYKYPRALFAHVGLYSKHDVLEPWAKKARDAAEVEEIAEILAPLGINRLFVGNWHTHREFHVSVFDGVDDLAFDAVQVGALVPTGFDNPGLEGYGGVQIWDTDTDEIYRVEVPGPRFVTVHSVEELAQYFPEPTGCLVFVRWVTTLAEVDNARLYLSALPGIGGFEVVVDKARAEAAAKSGAAAAQQQTTLRDAAIEYVGRIQLPPTVSREAVWSRVSRALKLEG